jgi:hypothetical protein
MKAYDSSKAGSMSWRHGVRSERREGPDLRLAIAQAQFEVRAGCEIGSELDDEYE